MLEERHAGDELYIETLAYNTFIDYVESRTGELITTDFSPSLLINEQYQLLVVNPAVEAAFIRQLQALLASHAVAETLKTVIAVLASTDNDVELFTTMMAGKIVLTRVSAALMTAEVIRSIATQLLTVPALKTRS